MRLFEVWFAECSKTFYHRHRNIGTQWIGNKAVKSGRTINSTLVSSSLTFPGDSGINCLKTDTTTQINNLSAAIVRL